MSSALAPCTTCRREIAPPDTTHRYCPFCGVQRVFSTAGGQAITLGSDVFDSSTGEMLGYADPQSAPERVHPVKGPHVGPQGKPWRDVFGSSGMLSPIGAHHPFGSPLVERSTPQQQPTPVHKPIHLTARQRSFYLLVEGGQLHRFSDSDLRFARGWSFPTVEHASPGSKLFSSFSLVGVISPVNQLRQLSAYDLVQGKRRIHLALTCTDVDACLVGETLYVLGVAADGSVRLDGYPLTSFAHRETSEPAWTVALGEVRPQDRQRRCRIEVLEPHLLLVMPNGWVLGVTPRGTEQPEPYEMLWPAPRSMQVVESQRAVHSPGGRLHLLLAGEHQPPALLAVESPAGRPLLATEHSLSTLAGQHPVVTSTPERIYWAHKPAGGPVTISSAPHDSPWDLSELTTLAGSDSHTIAGFEAVPYDGGVQLLVQTIPTDTDFATHFHLVHPHSGQLTIPPVGKPAREDRFEVAWTAGRTLLMNLSKGGGAWL